MNSLTLGKLGDLLFNIALDQINVAVVFFQSNFHVDGVGIHECAFRLIEKARNLLQARKHVAEANLFRSIVLSQRQEESVSDQLDINRGVVLQRMDFVEIQQVQQNLVIH